MIVHIFEYHLHSLGNILSQLRLLFLYGKRRMMQVVSIIASESKTSRGADFTQENDQLLDQCQKYNEAISSYHEPANNWKVFDIVVYSLLRVVRVSVDHL